MPRKLFLSVKKGYNANISSARAKNKIKSKSENKKCLDPSVCCKSRYLVVRIIIREGVEGLYSNIQGVVMSVSCAVGPGCREDARIWSEVRVVEKRKRGRK